jgi:hypothetical protein
MGFFLDDFPHWDMHPFIFVACLATKAKRLSEAQLNKFNVFEGRVA